MRPSISGSSLPSPVVQVRVPGSSGKSKDKKKGRSCLRNVVEILFFVIWLVCTGIAGYFLGYDPASTECESMPKIQAPVAPVAAVAKKASCPSSKLKPIDMKSPLTKDEGFTVEELKTMWECSHAEGEDHELNKQIFPDDMSMDKTKWKSIITVEPKAFFKKYLSQYPADTRAVQPVVVFSHKPLKNFDELSDVCKVIDIAVVPDKPGVCVAVTETYHDVASYHMLHADRQKDGSFALTGNSIEGRTLPTEAEYASARALLLDFFKHGDKVMTAAATIPQFNKGRVVVACLVDDSEDLELFLNSVKSAGKVGISRNKFAVFTTSESVNNDMKNTKIKVVYLPELRDVGRVGEAKVSAKHRRYFLQAWLAFACANNLIKVMWQTPGTYWIERPDNIVNAYPAVESLWAYKGRRDRRSAPFFATFDFFVAVGQERPVHLLHELILHFDLILAWDSLDAVASYRLSENNSRYGTTTYIMAPHKVVHSELLGHDAHKARAAAEAADAQDRPYVIIVPKHHEEPTRAKQFLIDAGLWLM